MAVEKARFLLPPFFVFSLSPWKTTLQSASLTAPLAQGSLLILHREIVCFFRLNCPENGSRDEIPGAGVRGPQRPLPHNHFTTIFSSRPGTKITFTPDETIFDTVEFKAEAIRDRLHETAYLNPGLTLVFCNERDGKEKEVFHEAEGLAGYVDFMLSGDPDTVRLSKTVTLHGERDGITVDAAFCYVNDYGETLVSFCNNINTVEGGTHVNGFKQAISKSINQYAHSLHKIKESQNYQAGDIRQGLLAVVSISHPAPRFDGQTKTKLDNNDALNAVSTVVTQRLSYIFDRDTRLIEELLKIVATNASNAPGGGAPNLSDKKFAFEGNGKLARQESSDPDKCELFIVEGKSAGGTAKTGRDRKYQAILPIRGKILNVEKQKIGRVLDNEEIRALVNALGCGFSEGFGNDFDIKKLRYHKIIIAADADVDGGHISTLLLTFFYRFLPELIHAGKLFRAMPPLYRVKPKRGKTEYLYDDKALAEYRKKHGTNFDIQRYKGLGEMDASQLWETTMDPRTRKLKKITMDDVIDANRMTSVLMGEEVPPRRKYIMDNADKANLDV